MMDKAPKNTTEVDSESLEANQAASVKLTRLMAEDFRNYGIRYMNINEYQNLMQSRISWREVSIFREDETGYVGMPFKKWLEQSLGRWSSTIHTDTDWGREGGGDRGVRAYEGIIQILKAARNEYRKNLPKADNTEINDKQPKVRQAVMKIFRRQLLDYLKKIQDTERTEDPLRNIKYNLKETEEALLKRAQQEQASPEDKYIKEDIADRQRLAQRIREHKKVIDDFLANDDFLKDKQNLHKLALSISDASSPLGSEMHPKNYHVAVIFNPSVIADFQAGAIASFKTANWRRLNWKKLEGDDIMGAVVIIPDKKLLEEVINESQYSGQLSHPILDSNGIPRYPKK